MNLLSSRSPNSLSLSEGPKNNHKGGQEVPNMVVDQQQEVQERREWAGPHAMLTGKQEGKVEVEAAAVGAAARGPSTCR